MSGNLQRCALMMAVLGIALLCASCATQPGGPTARTQGGVGYVTGPADEFAAYLTHGGSTIKIEGKAGDPVPLDAGKYALTSCTIRRADTDGAVWSLSATADRHTVTVRAGEITALEFGPPLKVSLRTSPRGASVNFDLAIEGGAGEQYSVKSIQRNGAAPGAPALSIADAAGAVVTKGRFKYG